MNSDKCFIFIDFILELQTGAVQPKTKTKSICLLSLNEKIAWSDFEERFRPRIEFSNFNFVEQISSDQLLNLFRDCQYYVAVSRKELYEYVSLDRIYDAREKVINKYFPEYKI